MVTNLLTKAIRNKVTESVVNFRLETPKGTLKAPQVVNGFLPPKKIGPDDDFPFVIVRPESGIMDPESQQIKVNIIVGCYSESFDGYEVCLNVVNRIIDKLSSLPGGILEGKYIASFPIRWNMTPEQPYPQWQIDIETNWTCRSPENTDDF